MSYTKSQILTLATTLSQTQADPVTLDLYFNTLLDDLGRLPEPLLLEAEVIPLVKDQEAYNLPDAAIIERAIFLDDHELRHTYVQQLEAHNPMWRDQRGRPYLYSKDEQTARTFRVFPIPNFNSTATDWTLGEPIGKGFPTDAITIFYTSRNSDKIPDWLVLPMCYQILSWEFSRPSNHQSQPFSDACLQLSSAMFDLLNIKYNTSKLNKEVK